MFLLSFGCIFPVVVGADVQGNAHIDMPPPVSRMQHFSFRNSRRLAQENFQKTSPNFFDFEPNCEQLGSRYCDYGPHNLGSGDEFASWRERTEFVYVNMARMDSTAFSRAPYSAKYSCTAKSGLDPFYWSSELTQAARFHSHSMAKLGFFSHSTHASNKDLFGNSVDFWDRLSKFVTSGVRGMGENIAAGSGTPLGVTNQWLASAGHCSQIFGSSDFMGVGYAFDSASRYRHYWTQNFLSGPTVPTQDIVAGTHDVTDGTNRFLVQVHMSRAPTSVSVVVGGKAYTMALLMGSTQSGTYFVDIGTLSGAGSDGCVQYYFVVNSGASRMPVDNSYHFLTYGVNGCKRNIGKGSSLPPANVCTCPNGTPYGTTASGIACPTHGAVMCASCDSGYSLTTTGQCKAVSGAAGERTTGGSDNPTTIPTGIDNPITIPCGSDNPATTDVPSVIDGVSRVDLTTSAFIGLCAAFYMI